MSSSAFIPVEKRRVESTAVVTALSTSPDLWKWIFINIIVSCNGFLLIPIAKTILVPDQSHYCHLYLELIDSLRLFSQAQKEHHSLLSRSCLHPQPCSFSTWMWSLLSFPHHLGADEDIHLKSDETLSSAHPWGAVGRDVGRWHSFCTDTRDLQGLSVPAQRTQEEQKSTLVCG